MNEEESRQVESSQRQHHEVLEHQDRAYIICQSIEYNLFAMLKPALTKDGNQWCVLYGENLQVGIAGFGDTPYEAILEWNKQWTSVNYHQNEENKCGVCYTQLTPKGDCPKCDKD